MAAGRCCPPFERQSCPPPLARKKPRPTCTNCSPSCSSRAAPTVHFRRFPAQHEAPGRDEAAEPAEADRRVTRALALSLMNEQAARRVRSRDGVQFRDLAAERVPLPRQRLRAAAERGMVVRTIASEIPTFEKLDLPEVLKDVIMTKRGLVLVVGGTGSGKSTTLAAMIDYRNANSAGHIITVEDPVEYVHKNKSCLITHREVGVDTHSWHNALKNTLRQAPDVILIGEIRDTETMEHAIAFAETGHLCLGTLHANNCEPDHGPDHQLLPGRAAQPAADGPVVQPARDRLAAPGAHRGRQGPQGGDRDPAEHADHQRDDPEGELPRHQGDHAQVARTGHVHLRPGAVRAVQQGPHRLRRSDPQRRLGQRPAPADQAVAANARSRRRDASKAADCR
jgi:energy-coupling factor transporter ATP-binding protein EcfA2